MKPKKSSRKKKKQFFLRRGKQPSSGASGIQEINDDIDYNRNKNTQPIKRQMHKILNMMEVAIPLDLINATLSLAAVSLYIYATYYPREMLGKRVGESWYPVFNIVIHVYFLIEYLLRLYTAKNFSKYFLSVDSFVDLLTTFPYVVLNLAVTDIANFWLLLTKMLDLLRLMTINRVIKYIENDINKELSNIILTVLALVVVMAGFVQFVENQANPFNDEVLCLEDGICYNKYHDTFFFIMITISVIGYNSNVVSDEGRVAIILFIAIVMIFIPNKSSKLVSLISSKSMYARRKYKAIDKVPHIVLIGAISQTALFNFLEEFFHEDHGNYNRHCVVMMP